MSFTNSASRQRYEYLLVVGPGRSGTDFLFDRLRCHPQIAFPEIKDGRYYRSLRRLRRVQREIGPDLVLADISNLAYRDIMLPHRISALTEAGVRTLVVVLIRDHVERAKSMMLFRASRGEPSAWLGREALERFVVRDRLKADQISAIYGTRAEVLAMDFRLLVGQTEETLESLATRCGIAPFPAPTEPVRTNSAARARWMPLSALGKFAAVALRKVGARRTLQGLKESPEVQKLFFKDASARPTQPGISPAHARILGAENAECWKVVAQFERAAAGGWTRQPHRGSCRRPAVSASRSAPPVSVVIPCRNAAETISETLEAVESQCYPGSVEIIVADGSDDDRTERVIRRDHTGVRVLRNPERIVSTGLNRAIAAASGEIIVRCDAHAVLRPGYIRRAVAVLTETGAANVGGRQVPAGDTFFTRAVGLALTTPLGVGDSRYKKGGPDGPVEHVYLGVFRRDAVEAVGGFDPTLLRNQDYELSWRLRQAGYVVWFDSSLEVEYKPRRNPAQLARQYYSYGRWKATMLLGSPASLRPRQLAPPMLWVALAVSAALGIAGQHLPAALSPLAYLLLLASGACLVGVRRRDPAAVLLPVVLATIHLSWGLGFFLPARRLRHTVWLPPTETAG